MIKVRMTESARPRLLIKMRLTESARPRRIGHLTEILVGYLAEPSMGHLT
ncbi:hypothetical protein Lalb_Chr20g0114511 [Lupinus albus]|uniref:Uncharacterized protein n=1 Tax=Lupinus albus TaxID=3870 RepID=A0A6A4NG87_LUPAL|nr:hypothetical protein Lalb_Chr20g0114511 [Lupinus albus]